MEFSNLGSLSDWFSAKKILRVVLIAIVSMIVCSLSFYYYNSNESIDLPKEFPEFDGSSLTPNEYLSKEMAFHLDVIKNFHLVKSFRAVSSDSRSSRTYVMEFTLKDGSIFTSSMSLPLKQNDGGKDFIGMYKQDVSVFPRTFQAQRVKDGCRDFKFQTDGQERKAEPEYGFFNDFAFVIKKTFANSETRVVNYLLWKQGEEDAVKKGSSFQAQNIFYPNVYGLSAAEAN